ncbi:MAG: hypothetical protein LUE86_06950 [Clostridiales bacterium]|nr:hypothetical protein [Clostridiales bacterium]
MKIITVHDGLNNAGVGYLFFFVFGWVFLFVVFLLVREKNIQQKRIEIKRLIERGNARAVQQSARLQDLPMADVSEAPMAPAGAKTPVKRSPMAGIHVKTRKNPPLAADVRQLPDEEEETWKEKAEKQAREDFRLFGRRR